MLIAVHDAVRVEAQSADRRLPYRCPGCDRLVTLRRGAVKAAHFAHQAKSSCGYASGETAAHLSAKLAFLGVFRARGLRAEPEHFVSSLAGDRRADVMVWSPNGQRVAVEIQHSPVSLDDLYRRSASYAAAGIAVCWIPVIDSKILNGARVRDDGGLVVRRYAAPHWQRWINGINYGRMWVVTSDLRLWDAKLKPHVVRIPGRSERIVPKWKDLHLVPVDLADARLLIKHRSYAEFGDHRYPAGPLGRIVAQPSFTTPVATRTTAHTELAAVR